MKTSIVQQQIQTQHLTSATRIAASTFGGIVSFDGVMQVTEQPSTFNFQPSIN